MVYSKPVTIKLFLTPARLKDLETIRFFIPFTLRDWVVTDQDIIDFFEYSERGQHKERVKLQPTDGFGVLCEGKRWRGIHMEMYEEGILSGDMPYHSLLEEMPRSVVDFMKREMFKGEDAELIECVYCEILKEKEEERET